MAKATIKSVSAYLKANDGHVRGMTIERGMVDGQIVVSTAKCENTAAAAEWARAVLVQGPFSTLYGSSSGPHSGRVIVWAA